jgi:hypothetical protein
LLLMWYCSEKSNITKKNWRLHMFITYFKLQYKKLKCDIFYWYRLVPYCRMSEIAVSNYNAGNLNVTFFYWYKLVPSCIIILKIAVVEKHIIEEDGKCRLKCQQKPKKSIYIIILSTFMSLALGTKCCKSFIDAIKNGILSSRTCRR